MHAYHLLTFIALDATEDDILNRRKQPPAFSLKDKLFNADRINYLGGLFEAVPGFRKAVFVMECLEGLAELELKERISHISVALDHQLSADFKEAASQISRALPPPLDPDRTDDDFGDFIFACLGEFVVRNGLSKMHLRRSLKLLRELTMRFSMEDAIRYFINEFPNETFAELEKWSRDKNYHVRRLASEGTRPLLPWSGRLNIDPLRSLPLLDQLHSDSTRYVTRSVANHLNDIAKTRPKVVVDTLKRWRTLGKQDADELDWMSRHALRTLVKKCHADALKLLGFRANPKVEVGNLQLSPRTVRAGEAIEFSFDISAARGERLLIDYVIDFVKANGMTSPKVHKIKQLEIAKGEKVTVSRRHPLKANATTFTLYPGTHVLTLQINGQRHAQTSFELVVA